MTENSFTDRFRDFDENYKHIKEKIALAAEKAGGKPEEIRLLAATKTVPVEVINHAIDSGVSLVGENRVQEFMDKCEDLHECERHFIGKLQTNKAKYLIGRVSMIESVDSVKLAKEISRHSDTSCVKTDILIEVNIGKEENKGGIRPEGIFEFIDEIRHFPSLNVVGLMAIPPISDDLSELSAYFDKMRQYFVDIKAKKIDNIYMNVLSMGMSDDFELAIEHGSNLIRLGTALFGRRN